MATDGEGGNPGGRGLFAGAMNALRGASQKSSSNAWNSGKFEFDTSGVRQFKTEIDAAEKSVAKFVGHFDRLSKILSGLDQKKLDALGKVGSTGGGSRNGGDVSFSGGAGTVVHGQDAPASSGDKVRSTDDGGGSGERGHNTNRFGGGGGGLAGAYFGAELLQRAGSRFAQSKEFTRSTWAGYDYANTIGSMRGGGSYNSYASNQAWSGMWGAESQEDATSAMVRSRMHWGTGMGGARQMGHLRNAAAMNALSGGMLGGQAGAVASWEQAFMGPQAQHALRQQGIRPAIVNGQPRSETALFSDIILRASGKSSFSDLSRKEAQAMFGYGGQGRQNLSVIAPGMSPEMIDAMTTLATSAAGGRGVGRALRSDELKNSIIGAEYSNAERNVEAGAEQTRRGRSTQIGVIRAEGELQDAANRLRSEFSNLIPVVQSLGGTIAGVVGAGAAAGGFMGDNGGEGGGGVRGVLRTAADVAILRSVLGRGGGGMLSGAARIGGRLAGRGLLTGVGSLVGEGLGGAVGERVGGRTGGDVGGFLGAVGGGAAVGAGIGVWGAGVGALPGAVIGGGLGAAGWGIGKLFGDPVAGANHYPDVGDPDDVQKVPSNLDPGFANNLRKMFHEAPFDITISSGRRSTADQERIFYQRHTQVPAGTPGAKEYKGKFWKHTSGAAVAVPGRSKHEKGHAVDLRIDGISANSHRRWQQWINANASRFGLRHGASFGEWWHIETPGTVSESGGTSTASDTPTPRATSTGGSSGGGFMAKHNFAEGFQTSTAGSVAQLGKAPKFEHSFSGMGGGTLGAGGAGGGTGEAPTGGSDGMLGTLRAAGFSGEGLRLAYAVMMGESQGNARAHNTNASTGDNSYGLFQINMLGKMGPARRKQYGLASNDDLFDPSTNARVAFEMSGGGKNWQPWSAYKNGSYKKYYRNDIGDAVDSGGGGGGVIARGGSSVSIGHVALSVTVASASQAEAERFARLAIDKIREEAAMASLGSN